MKTLVFVTLVSLFSSSAFGRGYDYSKDIAGNTSQNQRMLLQKATLKAQSSDFQKIQMLLATPRVDQSTRMELAKCSNPTCTGVAP